MKYIVTFSARKQPRIQLFGISLPTEKEEVKVTVETSSDLDESGVEMLARLAYGRGMFLVTEYIDHQVEVKQIS